MCLFLWCSWAGDICWGMKRGDIPFRAERGRFGHRVLTVGVEEKRDHCCCCFDYLCC